MMHRYHLHVILLSLPMYVACSSKSSPLQINEERTLDSIPVVYDFGGRTHDVISLTLDDQQQLRELFNPSAQSSREERHRIRRAVALLEEIAGCQTPMGNDLGKNALPSGGGGGQMDCIAESINTTMFLQLIQQHGFLKHHIVLERAFRMPYVFDTHYAGQIRDTTTGVDFAVDSWYLDCGRLPYVQRMKDWLRKEDFDPAENPDQNETADKRRSKIRRGE